VVSDSNQEKFDRRRALSDSPPMENCLATPVLLAIQGISRKERESQLQQQCEPTDNNEYQHKEFAKRQGQQYLCTGYDMYSFYEPSIFEAMACLHSRLRRLIYCRHQLVDGSHTARPHAVWTNGCTQHHIHDLPRTNHRYRVFEYRLPSNS
jgi:tRNA-specific adenosine deaminase 3